MKRFLIIFMCIFLITPTAKAAALDSITFNVEHNTATVAGNVGQSPNGKNVMLVVLNNGQEINAARDNIEYMNICYADKDGNYSQTFEFSGDSADYVFIAVQDDGTDESKTVSYVNLDTLDSFAQDVADGELSDSDIILKLNQYAEFLSVDMEYFSIPRNEAILLATIKECKNDIMSAKAQGLISAIDLAESECKTLDSIENAQTWIDVEEIVKTNAISIGINYHNFKNLSNKSKIFSQLIGKTFSRFDELAERLYELYDKYSESGKSGGSSSGVRGGSSSYGLSVGATTAIPPAVQVPTTSTNVFFDVDSSYWAWEAIEYLTKNGVVSGKGNGNFEPDGMVTRGEIAKMLTVALGYSTESVQNLGFDDVNEQMWQFPYVSTLTSLGIVNGVSDTLYGVDSQVSRQDLAVLLHRALLLKGITFNGTNSDFTDFDCISTYAQEAVAAIAGAKIINGMPDGSFSPMSGATRAQAAKLIYEMLQKIE